VSLAPLPVLTTSSATVATFLVRKLGKKSVRRLIHSFIRGVVIATTS